MYFIFLVYIYVYYKINKKLASDELPPTTILERLYFQPYEELLSRFSWTHYKPINLASILIHLKK